MSVSNHTQNVAVVGCGYWGRNLVRNFSQLGALRWICDADEQLLRAQAAVAPAARVTTQLDEVLGDPEVRGVVFATPAALHYQHVRLALLAGKDVFVEKPLALHYHEGEELVALAEARGALLMVGHILEYHPAVTLLRDVVASGELGEVRYVYSNRLNLGKVRQEENILWSFAPHDLAVISRLLGREPTRVSAVGASYLQPEIADVTTTHLAYEGGVNAHVFVSWLHPYKEQKLVVVGDRKMAVFDDTLPQGKLKIHDKGIDWRSGIPQARQTAETVLFCDGTEPLRLECAHFLDCLRDRRQPLTDGESALRVLKILEACQTSLRADGAPVELASLTSEVAA